MVIDYRETKGNFVRLLPIKWLTKLTICNYGYEYYTFLRENILLNKNMMLHEPLLFFGRTKITTWVNASVLDGHRTRNTNIARR